MWSRVIMVENPLLFQVRSLFEHVSLQRSQHSQVVGRIDGDSRWNEMLIDHSMLIEEGNQHDLQCWFCLPNFLYVWWLFVEPDTALLLRLRIETIQPTFVARNNAVQEDWIIFQHLFPLTTVYVSLHLFVREQMGNPYRSYAPQPQFILQDLTYGEGGNVHDCRKGSRGEIQSSWINVLTVLTLMAVTLVFGQPVEGFTFADSWPSFANAACHLKIVARLKHCSPYVSLSFWNVAVALLPRLT